MKTTYKKLNSDKEKYITFCEKKLMYIPIFSQPWWLEAVSNGDWDVILLEENGEIVACHPFFYIEHHNGLEIRKAPLTQNNGILIKYPTSIKYSKKLSIERKTIKYFIEQLESKNLVSYRQYFHYSFTNWLPFFWRGFNESTRYTYIIDNYDMNSVSLNMDSKLRNQIKKATQIVEVFEGMGIRDFYEFNKLTFIRQGLEIPYSFEIVENIEKECSCRGASKILYAKDEQGNIHSAIYIVEDDESVYYLLSGSDARFRDSQSLSLLLFKAIEYAASINKKFDFEGSMKENIEHYFAQFGAIQTPYMDIKKLYKEETNAI